MRPVQPIDVVPDNLIQPIAQTENQRTEDSKPHTLRAPFREILHSANCPYCRCHSQRRTSNLLPRFIPISAPQNPSRHTPPHHQRTLWIKTSRTPHNGTHTLRAPFRATNSPYPLSEPPATRRQTGDKPAGNTNRQFNRIASQ